MENEQMTAKNAAMTKEQFGKKWNSKVQELKKDTISTTIILMLFCAGYIIATIIIDGCFDIVSGVGILCFIIALYFYIDKRCYISAQEKKIKAGDYTIEDYTPDFEFIQHGLSGKSLACSDEIIFLSNEKCEKKIQFKTLHNCYWYRVKIGKKYVNFASAEEFKEESV